MKKFKFQHRDGYCDIIKATTRYWASVIHRAKHSGEDGWNKDCIKIS